jgi:hypothetical protein
LAGAAHSTFKLGFFLHLFTYEWEEGSTRKSIQHEELTVTCLKVHILPLFAHTGFFMLCHAIVLCEDCYENQHKRGTEGFFKTENWGEST